MILFLYNVEICIFAKKTPKLLGYLKKEKCHKITYDCLERKQMIQLEHGSATSQSLGNYDRPTDQPTDRPTDVQEGCR